MDGIINVYKEEGYTSHDVVAIIRKTLNTKKVGHTGTLDPDAEGVLPICVGKATKLSDIIMDGQKTYRTVLKLGITTTTEDASGEVLEEKEVNVSEERISEVLKEFIGEIEQIPPMYSAIKVNGKKLYELAREGKVIERKTRRISIYDMREVVFLDNDRIQFDVDCSKGTYIRTLCKDIGERLGCGGHMEKLTRTRTGGFRIENALKLEEIKDLVAKNQEEQIFLTMEAALSQYPSVQVDEKAEKLLYNGGKIQRIFWDKGAFFPENKKTVVVFDSKRKLVGLYEIQRQDDFFIKPLKMLI